MFSLFISWQQNIGLVRIVQTLKRINKTPLEPMVTLFTDLKTKGPTTDLGRAMAAVRGAGLKAALPRAFRMDIVFTRLLGLNSYDPNWPNYDTLYLSEAEREREGKQAFTATSFMGGGSPHLFEDIAFNDPLFSESFCALEKDPMTSISHECYRSAKQY